MISLNLISINSSKAISHPCECLVKLSHTNGINQSNFLNYTFVKKSSGTNFQNFMDEVDALVEISSNVGVSEMDSFKFVFYSSFAFFLESISCIVYYWRKFENTVLKLDSRFWFLFTNSSVFFFCYFHLIWSSCSDEDILFFYLNFRVKHRY